MFYKFTVINFSASYRIPERRTRLGSNRSNESCLAIYGSNLPGNFFIMCFPWANNPTVPSLYRAIFGSCLPAGVNLTGFKHYLIIFLNKDFFIYFINMSEIYKEIIFNFFFFPQNAAQSFFSRPILGALSSG